MCAQIRLNRLVGSWITLLILFLCSLKVTFAFSLRNNRIKVSANIALRRQILSDTNTHFSILPDYLIYSPSFSKSIEDNINNIVLIESLHKETEEQSKVNKLLYEWLSNNLKVVYPLIHKHQANFDDILILLQNTKPTLVQANISVIPTNISATINILVKPYLIIPSLLDKKEALLKDILNYVNDISDANEKFIKMLTTFQKMTSSTTTPKPNTNAESSNLVAFQSVMSLLEPQSDSYHNQIIQSKLNKDIIKHGSFSLQSFNEYFCKFISTQLLNYFDEIFPTTPSELGLSLEEDAEDRKLLHLFHLWIQSDDFTLFRTFYNQTNSMETSYTLSPMALFYTFLEENSYFQFNKISQEEIDGVIEKLVSASYVYSIVLSKLTQQIRQILTLSMLQNHGSYVKYYNNVLVTLELVSSTTGSLLKLESTDGTSLSSSQQLLPLIKRVTNSIQDYPSVEVTIDNTLLNENEKESFLQTYVTKILNSTNWNDDNNDDNDDDDENNTGVSAGKPPTNMDGDDDANDGLYKEMLDIVTRMAFPLDKFSDPTQTQSSPAGKRRPPGVKILDPPRGLVPPPVPPPEKDTYIDVSFFLLL